MHGEANVKRYAAVAIAFHWAIAVLILLNFPIAWTMHSREIDKTTAFALYQGHKTIGLTVLLLSIGRLLWRIMNPPPALPDGMAGWERMLSSAVHILFYVFMIGTPFLGWMMVSASPTGVPTLYFGVIPWPHIAPLAEMAAASKKGAHEFLEEAHGLAAWVILGLLALHVGGALKHQFIDKKHYLVRMAPGLFGHSDGPESKPQGLQIAVGSVVILLLLAAGLGAMGGKSATKINATPPAQEVLPPNSWVVDSKSSHVKFNGKHAANEFEGEFKTWRAQIVLNPADVASASVKVVIDTASASTGDAYYDSTLKQADWFDSANMPEAVFTTKAIRAIGGDKYEADAELALHGVTMPIILPFTLKIIGDKAEMKAELPLKRLDYKIGANSDPGAEWVADAVDLTIEVKASRPH
ncbi:MAG: YceI family protein [Caulobacterales bacterium]